MMKKRTHKKQLALYLILFLFRSLHQIKVLQPQISNTDRFPSNPDTRSIIINRTEISSRQVLVIKPSHRVVSCTPSCGSNSFTSITIVHCYMIYNWVCHIHIQLIHKSLKIIVVSKNIFRILVRFYRYTQIIRTGGTHHRHLSTK